MTVVRYVVSDAAGNPLAGVHIRQVNNAGWCGTNPVDGYTDASGKLSLDNLCYFGATGTWTADAPGYVSKTGTFNAPWPTGGPPINITLNQIATSIGGFCLPGYTTDPATGNCVQTASVNFLTLIANTVKANWLLIIVLAAAAALILAIFLRPAFFTGKFSAGKTGVTLSR